MWTFVFKTTSAILLSERFNDFNDLRYSKEIEKFDCTQNAIS